MSEQTIVVERLSEFTEADAIGIGRLLPFLSERLTGQPLRRDIIKSIIESPYHEQIVARDKEGHIVGAATLTLIMGPADGAKGFLDDLIVDPNLRGQGVGDKLWNEIIAWCRERGVNLFFTSKPSRKTAYDFYLRHGAVIRPTTPFRVDV